MGGANAPPNDLVNSIKYITHSFELPNHTININPLACINTNNYNTPLHSLCFCAHVTPY